MELLLALQTYPGDHTQALDLARLIADLEAKRPKDAPRPSVAFMVGGRRDSSQLMIEKIANEFHKIAPTYQWMGTRRSTTYPMAANDLWQEMMQAVSAGVRSGRWNPTGILTFEPDCLPLRADWIDYLIAEWQETLRQGKKVMGHHSLNRGVVTHINGNLVAIPRLVAEYDKLTGSPGNGPWDCHHGKLLLEIGRDTPAIYQCGRIMDVSAKWFSDVHKNTKRPALWHGVKDPRGIAIARELLMPK